MKFIPILKNIASKTIVYVIVVMIIIGANLAWFYPTIKSLRRQIVNQEEANVILATAKTEAYLARKISNIEIPGQYLSRDLASKSNETIMELLLRDEYFNLVSLVDPKGNEVIKFDKFRTVFASERGNLSGDPAFKDAIENGKPVFTDIVFSKQTFEPFTDLYVPIHSAGGGVRAVIVAHLNVSSLFDAIGGATLADRGKVYVLDGRGTLVSDPDLSKTLRTSSYKDREIFDAVAKSKNVVSAEDDTYTYINEDGVNVLSAGGYIPETGWIVVFEEPKNDALAEINRLSVFGVIAIFFIIFVGVLVRMINGALTKQKKMLESTVASVSLFSDILSQTSQSWGMMDLSGKIIDANNAFLTLFEFKKEELMGRPYVELLTPEERSRVVTAIDVAIHERRAFSSEVKMIKHDGTILDARLTVNAYYSESGELKYFYGFIADNTDIKRFEHEISEKAKDLKAKVDELERTTKLMVDRELRMIELKDEIRHLKERLPKGEEGHDSSMK